MSGTTVKLTVLYREDGRIVSVSRVAKRQAHDDGVPMMRSGVEPGQGQKVAVVEIDRAWHDRPLADIHQHFVVAQKGGNPTLRERGSKSWCADAFL
jgi:hypothetical protein